MLKIYFALLFQILYDNFDGVETLDANRKRRASAELTGQKTTAKKKSKK